MMSIDELSVAKAKLFDSLGENFKNYLRLLRVWFKSNLTKEEFDGEARKFLSPESIGLHNQFLIALLNKCQQLSNITAKGLSNGTLKTEAEDSITSTAAATTTTAATATKTKSVKSSRKKLKTAKVSFDRRFVPANICDYISKPYKVSNKLDSDFSNPAAFRLSYCNTEGVLPDHFMANLRILVCLWESGLDAASDDAISLLNIAVRDFIKNILTAVLSFKSSYRTLDGGVFKYAIGAPPVNHYLRNSSIIRKRHENQHSTFIDESGEQMSTIPPTPEMAEHEAMFQIACSRFAPNSWSSEAVDNPKVTMWHLFHALKLNKAAIPSHSVYAVNIERIITRLWQEDEDGS